MCSQNFLNSLNNYINEKNKKNLNTLKKNFKKLKIDVLNKDQKYVILKKLGKNKKDLSEKMLAIGKISNLVAQNYKKDLIVEVKPKIDLINKIGNRKKVKKTLRYHQTNLGGSIHTDGPQLNTPPKYIVMGCVNNSKRGGLSIILDSKKIYDTVRKNKKFKNLLYKKFYFERRGFAGKKILLKKIFTVDKKNFIFRYLRDYIDSAYNIVKKEISPKKLELLNFIDNLMYNKKFHVKYKLLKGDVIILNNYRLAHGRTNFAINQKNTQRNLLRMWLQK